MEKGFFGSLFDLSFTSFVTTKLIKVLYVLSLVLLVILYIVVAVSIFSSGDTTVSIGDDGTLESDEGGNTALGIVWLLVIGPLMLFFYTLLYRVFFELIIVLFRIFENTRDQLALTRAIHPEAAARVAAEHGPHHGPGAGGPTAGGPGASGPNLPGT